MTLAKSSSSPSAANTGSRIAAAMRFGSPRHLSSPSLNGISTSFRGSAPTNGSSDLISGLPSRNDCRSRRR